MPFCFLATLQMPKTKEEIAAYQKAYRERKKEELKAKRAEAYKEKAATLTAEEKAERSEKTKARVVKKRAEGKPLLSPEAAKRKVGYNTAYREEHKKELKAKATAKRPAPIRGRYRTKAVKAAEAAEAAEAKARRDEADAEAQKVEATTRARILAKRKAESPAEDIPEYLGPMEGLVPPEPPQPEMGLVAPQAPAPVPVAKPPGKRELAKEAKRQQSIKDLEAMAKNIEKESGRRDVESSKRYFDKLRRGLGLPATFYQDVIGPRVRKPGYTPPTREEREAESEARVSRARAMISAGGGGAIMLPLLTGFNY